MIIKIPEIYIWERRDIFPENAEGKKTKYLTRWIVFEVEGFGGIYIHKFWASDHDRCCHDHPWNFLSFILKGKYIEHYEYPELAPRASDDLSLYHRIVTGRKLRKAFTVAYRPATWRHRVEILTPTVWTLMFVSKRVRKWGFWPAFNNWCWWRKYNTTNGICESQIIHTYGKD